MFSSLGGTNNLRRALLPCAALLALLLLTGCDNMGKDLRRALRGAATGMGKPKSSPEARARLEKQNDDTSEVQLDKLSETTTDEDTTDDPNGVIRSCPKGSKLSGEGPPNGLAQWCVSRAPDGRMLRNGEYRRWHKGAGLKQVGSYRNGKPHGKFTEYFRNGTIKETAVFGEGVPDGEFTQYYKDGTKQLSIVYHAGLKNGTFQTWSKDGAPKEKGGYQNNEKTGPWQKFHQNGQISSLVTYRAGMKTGKTEEYNAEGVLLQRGQFLENTPDGNWQLFFDDGTKKSEGAYRRGQRDGRWTTYRRNGSIQNTLVYADGTVTEQQVAQAQSAGSSQRASSGSGRQRRGKSFGATDSIGAPAPFPDRGPIRGLSGGTEPPVDDREERGWKPM